MKPNRYALGLAAGAALSGLLSSADAATLVLRYDQPAAIAANSAVPALTGPAGTTIGGAVTLFTAQQGTDGTDAYGLSGGAAWDTGKSFNSFTPGYNSTDGSSSDQSFTMFAIVTPTDLSNDHMVFGTAGGSPMHIGLRGDAIFFGLWGNDSGAAGGTAPAVNTTAVITWRFTKNQDGSYTQDIFKNGGTPINSTGGKSAFGDGATNLLIGRYGGGGAFQGGIDDIRMYSGAMTNAEVAATTAEILTADVPEPSLIGSIIGGATLVLARRRQR